MPFASITSGNAGGALNGFNGSYATPAAVAFQNSSVFGFLGLTVNDENSITAESFSFGTGGTSSVSTIDSVTLEAEPQVAVPTSYVGSEATPIRGESRDGKKVTQRDPRILPRVVVYDLHDLEEWLRATRRTSTRTGG